MLSKPLDLDEALNSILQHVRAPNGTELVSLDRALRRVTATPVGAHTDLPPFRASAMDGYAYLWSANLDSLTLIGQSLAGHPFTDAVERGQCVRIMTGAALPAATDTVVIQENCTVHDNQISVATPPAAGANVRNVGHDVQQNQIVLPKGKTITAFDVGTLAACGIAEVDVFTRPRVGVFSTGDELQVPGSALAYGNIFDSNRYAVVELLADLPVEVDNLGVLPDDATAISQALLAASARCDVLLTSGGVSVGDADHVKNTLEAIGTLNFWRLNLKPGKPLAFGEIGDCLFFGLPGNPVSTIVTLLMIAKPAIAQLCGTTPTPPLTFRCELRDTIIHRAGREEYQRGVVSNDHPHPTVNTTGDQSSNRMSSFTHANCLIRIPKDCDDLLQGSSVDVLPLYGLA